MSAQLTMRAADLATLRATAGSKQIQDPRHRCAFSYVLRAEGAREGSHFVSLPLSLNGMPPFRRASTSDFSMSNFQVPAIRLRRSS